MNRRLLGFALMCLVLALTWTTRGICEAPTGEGPADPPWSLKAGYTDACCCKPSCPCFFGSPPTLGFCEGISLVDFEEAHYGDVELDGVRVVAVYRGGDWIKFYVDESATAEQTEAAVKFLPTFEEFFAIENVLEVKNVPISVEHGEGTVKVTTPNTTAEMEVMLGKNGKPIKIQNLPGPGFPALPMNDHTQYQTVVLKHEGENNRFEHTGTNGLTAKVEAKSTPGS